MPMNHGDPAMTADAPANLPIVIAADGTVFPTDMRHELLIDAMLRRPPVLWRVTTKARHGSGIFFGELKRTAPLDPRGLPVNADLVAWLKRQHQAGRPIHLLDDLAADLALQGPLAGIAHILPDAISSVADLQRHFPQGFAFAGRGPAHATSRDAARSVIATDATAGKGEVEADLAPATNPWLAWLQAVRPHHWAKNLMIFIPFMLDRGWTNVDDLIEVTLGFALLVLLVSATYLFNDLSDLGADRRHWSKQHRPVARGAIPVAQAGVASIVGASLAVVLAWFLSPLFAGFLALYLIVTVLYSTYFKTVPLLDALVIALLFTDRLMMGIALTGDRFSEWLLTFAMFFFFSLALAKRHTEVLRSGSNSAEPLARRGYVGADAALTLVIGVGSGIAALVIMVIFLVLDAFQRQTFVDPTWLWCVPLLLAVWLGRVWLLAHREALPDDPISFALRDRPSLLLGVLVAIAFILAL